MRKLLSFVFASMLAWQVSSACPSSGCVEIMAVPSGEAWGYTVGLTAPEIAYDSANVTAVEAILDENQVDSGRRRLRISLGQSDTETPVDASYYFQVKQYNGANQLVSTSSAVALASTSVDGCHDEVGTIGSANCSSSFFTCFLHGCECRYECPGAGCVILSSSCDFSLSSGCGCPYNWSNCDPFDPPCADPQLIAEWNNSCPAGYTCVVHIDAWENL